MNPRACAVKEIANRKPIKSGINPRSGLTQFGHLTFNREVMKKMLSKEIFAHMQQVMDGRAKLKGSAADKVAEAMKEWAISHSATHFTHWFQPLTGTPAEKHDAFIDWRGEGELIEKFTGKILLRGEPDASSFPSGGLRRTHQARGYTTWDPTSYAFLWKTANSVVLCVPSFFYSWTGEALDHKIPLMRSDRMINEAALRLMRLFSIPSKHVYSTLGCEQEYFIVDKALYQLRPDLIMVGRTVCGTSATKEQELEAHYFRMIKERVMAFIQEFETEGYALGIPLKTRHSEVAPGQFEVAPIYEKASLAVDHNLVLMELMKEVANRHGLVCLLHEKPFQGINGSGKHNNWSLATDTGLNLLDPTDSPGTSLPFLIMLTATIYAVYHYSALLRTSISSAGNDHRLGGHEAPPPIISIFLGDALEHVLESIEKEMPEKEFQKKTFDLNIPSIPEIPKDHSDRNRTSPFAFTGNKFEFRAVGSSQNCAFPITLLNTAVAKELNNILDEIESHLKEKKGKEALKAASLPVIRKYLKASKFIRFLGDGYSPAWREEAKRRGLPIIEKSFHAFQVLKEEKTVKLFEHVLSKEEILSRYMIMVERYSKIIHTEAKLMMEIFRTQILPSALEYQKLVKEVEPALLKKLPLHQAMKEIDHVEELVKKATSHHGEEEARIFAEEVAPQMQTARKYIDSLEEWMDDRLWQLPKYREMLFLL